MKTNCVISAVGKNSLHRKWMEGEMNFDLHLIVYDDSIELFREDTEHICHMKGFKLKLVYNYLQAHPYLLAQYEYFFLPDDDILMNADCINKLFSAMRHYQLKIAQPALTLSYYTWTHTLKDRYCTLRYTDFIEMMVPCFERDALKKVLFTFNENETGWGTESHWSKLIQAAPEDMAIIDEISVIHSRPIQSGQDIHKRELGEYLKKYNLTLQVNHYGEIPSDLVFCVDKETFRTLKYTMIHWMASERISTTRIGMDGYFGYIYTLFLFAGMTQDRNYADAAYNLLEHVQEYLGAVKNDMTFGHGITGCCWLIEFLSQEGFIENDPQEILEEVNQHISLYVEQHRCTLSIAELTGIGMYYQMRQATHPTEHYRKEAEEIALLLAEKVKDDNDKESVDIMMDALMVMKGNGIMVDENVYRIEQHIIRTDISQVERVYYKFKLYLLTRESYWLIQVQESMKNLLPQLMTLEDVRMLAEIMYHTKH